MSQAGYGSDDTSAAWP